GASLRAMQPAGFAPRSRPECIGSARALGGSSSSTQRPDGPQHMTRRAMAALVTSSSIFLSIPPPTIARAAVYLPKVNRIVFMMQETRSFDNYFGALPYVPGGPYHPCLGGKRRTDHQCVDGLTCERDSDGRFTCSNYNLNLKGEKIFAFHDRRICGT